MLSECLVWVCVCASQYLIGLSVGRQTALFYSINVYTQKNSWLSFYLLVAPCPSTPIHFVSLMSVSVVLIISSQILFALLYSYVRC